MRLWLFMMTLVVLGSCKTTQDSNLASAEYRTGTNGASYLYAVKTPQNKVLICFRECASAVESIEEARTCKLYERRPYKVNRLDSDTDELYQRRVNSQTKAGKGFGVERTFLKKTLLEEIQKENETQPEDFPTAAELDQAISMIEQGKLHSKDVTEMFNFKDGKTSGLLFKSAINDFRFIRAHSALADQSCQGLPLYNANVKSSCSCESGHHGPSGAMSRCSGGCTNAREYCSKNSDCKSR